MPDYYVYVLRCGDFKVRYTVPAATAEEAEETYEMHQHTEELVDWDCHSGWEVTKIEEKPSGTNNPD